MQHRLAAVGAWLFLRQRQASFDGLLFVAGLRGQVRASTGTTQAGAGDCFFLCLRQASFDGLLFVAGLRGQVRASTGTTQTGAGDWFFHCLRQAAAVPGLWFSDLSGSSDMSGCTSWSILCFRLEQVYFLVSFVFQT